MSLVRMGMSESKGYAEGYEAIFGKRERFQVTDETPRKAEAEPKSEPVTPPTPEKSE